MRKRAGAPAWRVGTAQVALILSGAIPSAFLDLPITGMVPIVATVATQHAELQNAEEFFERSCPPSARRFLARCHPLPTHD